MIKSREAENWKTDAAGTASHYDSPPIPAGLRAPAPYVLAAGQSVVVPVEAVVAPTDTILCRSRGTIP